MGRRLHVGRLQGPLTCASHSQAKMHLYYHMGEDGKRVYTLKKKDPEGKVSASFAALSLLLPFPQHMQKQARSSYAFG